MNAQPASSTAPEAWPAPPGLQPLCRLDCIVGPVVSLGRVPQGERRYVQLLSGRCQGPGLNATLLEGGMDWQLMRDDEVLEISAHYALRTDDGALVEVHSQGLRHGPPEVMARLARGEPVASSEYFFRTALRFASGAPGWQHLNRTMGVGLGERDPLHVRVWMFALA